MNKKILPWLIAFCALGLGGTAAYYSVIGLSKLFAGVATAVIIMASFLEISKLTLATLLHSFWKELNKLARSYFVISLIILSLITSMGIYGMLSSGYEKVALKEGNIEAQIELLEVKRNNVEDQLLIYNEEKTTINTAISELRKGLSNNVIQYKDPETGEIITTTSSSTRRALEKQLDQALERQTEINNKVDDLNTQLFGIETEITETQINNNSSTELGPLKYISRLTGWSMDKVVNWLLIVIMFVFDPLAIALVIAANFAFSRLRPKLKENIYGEKIPENPKIIEKIPEVPKEEMKSLKEEKKTEVPPPPSFQDPRIQNPGLSAWRRNKIMKAQEEHKKRYW